MATEKQTAANRANAQKSTGPKTQAGKDRAARNATRHGLYSTRAVCMYEHLPHFEQLRDNLLRDWAPRDSQEALLVEQIAQAAWRLQRAIRIETGAFDVYSRELCHRAGQGAHNPHGDEGLAIVFAQDKFGLDRLRRYITATQRSYHQLIHQLLELQQRQPDDHVTAPPDPPTHPKQIGPRRAAAAGAGARVIELASFHNSQKRPPTAISKPNLLHMKRAS